MRKAIGLCAALLLILGLPVWAIVVCHDYTHWRALGTDPVPLLPGKSGVKGNGLGVTQLRAALKAGGDREFKLTVKAHENPEEAQRHLKVGDVIVLGDTHSGIVSDAEGHIDHWLQKFGESGVIRAVNDPKNPLPAGGQGQGGLFLKDDLRTFLQRPFRPNPNCAVVIWRKAKS